MPRTMGGQQFVVGFDVRFVRFFEQQTALNLASVIHEWVNNNDFSRYAPCPNAKTWTSQSKACVAEFVEFVAPDFESIAIAMAPLKRGTSPPIQACRQ
ncbi:MAG: hypothetical protein JKY96_05905, partial [Phycisphaerales bacterium]|nr:hypothetical protein [Phycisphaerales bacterium]